MSYRNILFDLDGTLTDSALGITNSVMYSLKKFDIEVHNRRELYRFVGPPLLDSYKHYYGFSNEAAETAVEYYREYYQDKGIFENELYEGYDMFLQSLKNNGKTLIIATSKPEFFAKQIANHFGIAKYFTYIAGSNMDGTRVKKDEVIQYALECCKITDLSSTIMIGDREHDINGAKLIKIPSIGVLFGYGDHAELERAGANYIVKNLEELGKILLD